MLFFALINVKALKKNLDIEQIEETICFVNYNEYEKERLLSFNQKIKRFDYKVTNETEILEILKKTGNNNCFLSKYFKLQIPGYNDYSTSFYNHNQLGYWYFKNPPKNLITVYFKLNKQYKVKTTIDYQYTLDDLLNNETSIEEIHIFWNKNK